MVRTMTNDGKSKPAITISTERAACKEKILGIGLKYRGLEGKYGQLDDAGNPAEETLYFIEQMPELIKI